MAKSKIDLPSADDMASQQPPTKEYQETQQAVTDAIVGDGNPSGFLPRAIDVKMNRAQAAKFKALMRELEDQGATLADGTPVNNRRRVVLWLIENY